ncbi:hypothetical protein EDD36DRAFT_492863 [Exophiala viscosa]|uniref:Uncharacterized protein n=1 Tax=Exophiala viscosa TaxID=2486360 RepID=A0AAN6E187_9EURO|nr:hypothetical protein EDD36DRAFT_492863 [Exophiala viscosa]
MSFTLYHTKRDGSKEAIKMSIFDAFRGVPDPKPRKPRMCPCCGKPHTSKTEATGGKKDKAKDEGDKEKAKPAGKDGEETDDETIWRMKTENPQEKWKAILVATNGFQNEGEVRKRFSELKKEKSAEQEESKDGDEGSKKDQDDDKAAKKAKTKEEGLKKQAEAKARKEAEENAKSEDTGDAEKTDKKDKGQKSQKKSDNEDKKPKGDKDTFQAWAHDYDKKKWQTLASKHYDKTGDRMTADEARKMAEGK